MFELSPFRRRRELVVGELGREFMRDFFGNDLMDFGPSMRADIKETTTEYIVEAELPGLKKDDIVLELRDNTLTISAQKNEEVNEERENYVRRERRQGKMSRSFYVAEVDTEAVKAEYTDGILRITLPKLKESAPDTYRINIG